MKASLLLDLDRISCEMNRLNILKQKKTIDKSGNQITSKKIKTDFLKKNIKIKNIQNKLFYDKLYNDLNIRAKAILKIQAFINSKKTRDDIRRKEKIEAATKIQAVINGKNIRNYKKFAIFFKNYRQQTKASNIIKASILAKKIRQEQKKINAANIIKAGLFSKRIRLIQKLNRLRLFH